MAASDLRVTVDSAKLRCVLDPALALGHQLGARWALALTRAFETWLPRSFWQALDASDLIVNRAPRQALAPHPVALAEWAALRDATDAGSWVLRWVGDNLAESQLRAVGDDAIVERFEWFAAALAQRHETARVGRDAHRFDFDPLVTTLDAIALSATLDGALLLSGQVSPSAVPWPVRALEQLGLPVEAVDSSDATSLFLTERVVVRHALAEAGLAVLAQWLGQLSVTHVWAMPEPTAGEESIDPWHHARAWWYSI